MKSPLIFDEVEMPVFESKYQTEFTKDQIRG